MNVLLLLDELFQTFFFPAETWWKWWYLLVQKSPAGCHSVAMQLLGSFGWLLGGYLLAQIKRAHFHSLQSLIEVYGILALLLYAEVESICMIT